MKAIGFPLLACAILILCGCEKKLPDDPDSPIKEVETASVAPASDDPNMVGVAVDTPQEQPAAAPVEVEAVAKVDLDPETIENRRVKAEVLKRIDVMPNLTPEEKDKLYVQVERARAMGKVITIPFASGRTSVGSSDLEALGEKLQLGQVADLTSDPTVVFVVLGFADKKGDPDQNIEISRSRADSVIAALRDRFRVMNVMHSVGMGSSEMFDADNLDKNRVVELWAVLP